MRINDIFWFSKSRIKLSFCIIVYVFIQSIIFICIKVNNIKLSIYFDYWIVNLNKWRDEICFVRFRISGFYCPSSTILYISDGKVCNNILMLSYLAQRNSLPFLSCNCGVMIYGRVKKIYIKGFQKKYFTNRISFVKMLLN